jgi:hypothetical protein
MQWKLSESFDTAFPATYAWSVPIVKARMSMDRATIWPIMTRTLIDRDGSF